MLEFIYVCRHGFRSNWVDPSIKTGPTGMNRDPRLAAYGALQANRVAEFLSDPTKLSPYPIPERVFSSPFYRCIETALPTYQALSKQSKGEAGCGVMLEHGVMEWYSTVNPDTGLHPRPSDPDHLSSLFPPHSIDVAYTSTLFPSRRGESIRELQGRADTFVEAWTGRVEELGVKCVVVFAHAASVIALGRALTGDKSLQVSAGCASTSLYQRRPRDGLATSRSTTSLAAANTLLEMSGISSLNPSTPLGVSGKTGGTGGMGGTEGADQRGNNNPTVDLEDREMLCGVGEWDAVFLGRADYLENGVERDWSFRDVEIRNGEVINDNGDRAPHRPEDQIPTGLAPGMERYLRRGLPSPNGQAKEETQTLGADDHGGARM